MSKIDEILDRVAASGSFEGWIGMPEPLSPEDAKAQLRALVDEVIGDDVDSNWEFIISDNQLREEQRQRANELFGEVQDETL